MSWCTSNGFVLSVAFFVSRSSTYVVDDFVFVYLKQLGYNAFYIGLIPMFGFVTQLVGVPVCSYLSDRFHLRKFMLFMAVLLLIPTILLHLIPEAKRLSCVETSSSETSLNLYNGTTNKYKLSKREREILKNKAFFSQNMKIVPTTIMIKISKNHKYTDKYMNMSIKEIISMLQKNKTTQKRSQNHTDFLLVGLLFGIFQLLKRIASLILMVAALDHLKEEKSKFGFYQGCGTVGSGIVIFVSAFVAGNFKHAVCGEQKPSYYFVFVIAAGLQCFALLAVPWLKFDYGENVKSVNYKEAIKSLFEPYSILLFIALHVGTATSFLFCWTYWYVEKLGGSTTVIGVEGLVNRPIIGTFWYIASGYIYNAVGEYFSVLISLSLWAILFAFLALIENPWLVIVADNFDFAAYAIFYSALVVHFSNAAPENLSLFFQGVAILTINTVGKEIGSAIIGYCLNEYGIKSTMCGITVISLILFAVFAVYASSRSYNYKRLETEEGIDTDEEK